MKVVFKNAFIYPTSAKFICESNSFQRGSEFHGDFFLQQITRVLILKNFGWILFLFLQNTQSEFILQQRQYIKISVYSFYSLFGAVLVELNVWNILLTTDKSRFLPKKTFTK